MKFDNPYNIFLYDKAFELGTLYDNNYKGNSTKKGNNHKVIAKRRKRNKNKKTRNELLDIRHNYYKLLNIISSEVNSSTKNLPVLDDCDEADANTIVRYYGQASKIKALNESFDLVIEAIKELNLVISGKI